MNLDSNDRHGKMSRFMCQELLYEFVTARLDTERQRAVADYLSTCRDSQRELEHLKRGLRFTLTARQTEISESMREALLNFEPQWKKTFAAWTLWSSQRGWKILPYLFIIATLSLGLAVTKPWQDFLHRDVVLLDQAKPEPDSLTPPPDAEVDSVPEKPMVEATTPAEPIPPQPPMPSLVPNLGQPDSEPVAASEETAPANAANAEPQGLVTNGEVSVDDFASAWPAIREKIEGLGGKAAGNTELGILRNPSEAYFHFSLPESKRAELEEYLRTFGPVQFGSERHPRVMPEGQIRIILTVKDGSKSDEGREKAETP